MPPPSSSYPSLANLSLRSVVETPDLLELLLTDPLSVSDYTSAREIAKDPCVTDQTFRRACEALWEALILRFFANSPVDEGTLRGTFLSNCKRADLYREGKRHLEDNKGDRRCATFVLQAMRSDASQMVYADQTLLQDTEFVKEAAKIIPDYRKAHDLAMDGDEWDPNGVEPTFWYALNDRFFKDSSVTGPSTELDTLRANCERAVDYRRGFLRLTYDDSASQNDHECATFVLEAVSQDYTQIRDASERLKNDVAFMIRAVRASPYCLTIASNDMQGNRDVVLAAVDSTAAAVVISYASPELKSDREIVMVAVTNDADTFLVVDQAYRNDKDVVLAAVQSHAYALPYASEGLRGDVDVVMAAMRKDPSAYVHALPPARDDPRVQALRPTTL
tara:strand:+ start:755 stop:1927 length:1173 start_codon:yes stop_codon:yes gene_type:complete